jgi:chromosome segregation ATPase
MDDKKEIADFSDMGENTLPDTIEETPMGGQHIAVSYEDEESLKGKGQPQEETPETQEEKSFKYWQSQHDKKEKELQDLRNRYQQDTQQFQNLQREIQQLRGELTPKVKEDVLVKPQRPNTDDPIELMRWQSDMIDYQDKLREKDRQEFQRANETWQQAEQRREAELRYAQEKAFHIGQLQSTGLSPEEANEAFSMYAKAQEDPNNYYKDLSEFYRFKKGQFGTPKGDQMGKRATRQGDVPSLANVTSETETQKKDPSQEFFGDLKNFEKRYY